MPEFKGVVTVAVLNPELDRVITGYYRSTNTRRLLNSETESRNHLTSASLEDDARRCARRILETHAQISEQNLNVLSLINERQPTVKPGRTGKVYAVQYFFLAVINERAKPRFGSLDVCGLEDVHFTNILEAVASWQLSPGVRNVKGSSRTWSNGNPNRINPYHAMNLARSLIFLRECIGADPSGEAFRIMLSSVGDYGIHNLDGLIEEINCAMRERRV